MDNSLKLLGYVRAACWTRCVVLRLLASDEAAAEELIYSADGTTLYDMYKLRCRWELVHEEESCDSCQMMLPTPTEMIRHTRIIRKATEHVLGVILFPNTEQGETTKRWGEPD